MKLKFLCRLLGHIPIPLEKELRTKEGFLHGICHRCLDFIIFHPAKGKWVTKPESLDCPKCGYRGAMLNRFSSVIHTAKGPIPALDYDPKRHELPVHSPETGRKKE